MTRWRPLMVVTCLTLTACVRQMPHTDPAMPVDERGIPHTRFLVGDAREMTFQAPEDGRLIVVEQTSRTVVGSQFIEQNQTLHVSQAMLDETEMAARLGINPDQLRPWLYFIPERELERIDQQRDEQDQ